MMSYLFDIVCDTIQKENRYRSFRQKNHVCVIFDKKKIYSVGVNYTLQQGSIHSEMDAFNRLEPNTKKNPKKLNVLVVRVCYKHASEKYCKSNTRSVTYDMQHSYEKLIQNLMIETSSESSDDSISELDEDSEELPQLRENTMKKEKIIDINNYINQLPNNQCYDGLRFRMSKPCLHCIQHMKQSCLVKNYSIKKIYYTIDINFIYESNLNEISINPHISSYNKFKVK